MAGNFMRATTASHFGPLAAIGCEIALADPNDAASVARAMDGARAVQIVCPVPRAHDVLRRAGLSEQHARLIADRYDAHNAGRIDVDPEAGERRFCAHACLGASRVVGVPRQCSVKSLTGNRHGDNACRTLHCRGH
jgi:hypothetical protein